MNDSRFRVEVNKPLPSGITKAALTTETPAVAARLYETMDEVQKTAEAKNQRLDLVGIREEFTLSAHAKAEAFLMAFDGKVYIRPVGGGTYVFATVERLTVNA